MSSFTDESLLPIGKSETSSSDLCPILELRALQIYHQAWRDYWNVGCPYGETDEAMLVWFSLPDSTDERRLLSGRN